jgi:hypothetical protein
MTPCLARIACTRVTLVAMRSAIKNQGELDDCP